MSSFLLGSDRGLGGGSLAGVRGGGAEYVLIGAPVKQLEGHILART